MIPSLFSPFGFGRAAIHRRLQLLREAQPPQRGFGRLAGRAAGGAGGRGAGAECEEAHRAHGAHGAGPARAGDARRLI